MQYEWIEGGKNVLLAFEMLIYENGGREMTLEFISREWKQNNANRWTKGEVDLLARQLAKGIEFPKIGMRSRMAVYNKIMALSIPRKVCSRPTWSDKELKLLKEAQKKGFRPDIDKTDCQILRRLRVLGLKSKGMGLLYNKRKRIKQTN